MIKIDDFIRTISSSEFMRKKVVNVSKKKKNVFKHWLTLTCRYKYYEIDIKKYSEKYEKGSKHFYFEIPR